MTIDFYVSVVDNYGDMGFAFNLACILTKKYPNLKIRIFGDNFLLFKKLSGEKKLKNITYFDINILHEYIKPSNLIFNFFDRKLDFDYLHKFDYEINIINFGYFLLHFGVESLHNTNYKLKNLNITHFIPSFLENTGGILINHKLQSRIKKILKDGNLTARKSFLSDLENDLYDKKWISVFVYKDTFKSIKDFIKENSEYVFFIFDNNLKSDSKNIINMPFLTLDNYYIFLSLCDKNIVRGENSLVESILVKKPFLWDIYKEDNKAHEEKIIDFSNYINSNFGEKKEYNDIFSNFNLQNKTAYFKQFLEYEDEDLFFNFGKKIKKIDLVKNLEKFIFEF